MIIRQVYQDGGTFAVWYDVERVDPGGVIVFEDGLKIYYDTSIFDYEIIEDD